MDEKMKHRIIGFVVIFAVIAILAPIVVKTTKPIWKTIQKTTTFHIPNATLRRPTIAIKEEPEEWKKPLDVATVSLDAHDDVVTIVDGSDASREMPKTVNKVIEPQRFLLSHLITIPELKTQKISVIPKRIMPTTPHAIVKLSTKNPITRVRPGRKSNKKQRKYQIQLGTFKRQKNAEILVKKLQDFGYAASAIPVKNKKGDQFRKVILANTYKHDDLLALLQKLTDKLKIKGIARRV